MNIWKPRARSFEPLTKSWTFLKCSYSLSFHSWVQWEVILLFYFSALQDLFNSYSTNSQLLKYKWSFQKLNSPRTNVHSIAQSTYIGPEKELLFQRLRKVKYLLWKYCTMHSYLLQHLFSVFYEYKISCRCVLNFSKAVFYFWPEYIFVIHVVLMHLLNL